MHVGSQFPAVHVMIVYPGLHLPPSAGVARRGDVRASGRGDEPPCQLLHRQAISLSGKLDSLFVIVERLTGCNLVGGRRALYPTIKRFRSLSLSVCF